MNDEIKIQIGIVGTAIIKAFSLDIEPETPIYWSESNQTHMQSNHPDDFILFGSDLESIIATPDFVGINPNDSSLEYYKEYDCQTIHVKVAVRPTARGIYYARTLYEISEVKKNNYLLSGHIKPC